MLKILLFLELREKRGMVDCRFVDSDRFARMSGVRAQLAYTAQFLTLYQNWANNQYRTANQI